jgi:hypothetical protein
MKEQMKVIEKGKEPGGYFTTVCSYAIKRTYLKSAISPAKVSLDEEENPKRTIVLSFAEGSPIIRVSGRTKKLTDEFLAPFRDNPKSDKSYCEALSKRKFPKYRRV